jgi:hypothetical protein
MGMELEWRLQIMIEVGNAIMENGGLGREGGGTREFEKLLEEANGRLRKKIKKAVFRKTILGRWVADSCEAGKSSSEFWREELSYA